MLFRVNKLLFVAFLLLAVSAASASPTVTHQDAVLTANSQPADTPTLTVCVINDVAESPNPELANLGRQLLQPPEAAAGLSSSYGKGVKPLPAVPAAVFMVLSGFFCVSLVKDRRVWLAVLAGLLWVGQAGIQALPQLAFRLSHINHSKQQFCAKPACRYHPEDFDRLRSDIEGTRYIGLLHHLAGIPDGRLILDPYFWRASSINTSQPAIILEQHSLNSLLAYLALRAEQFICFSPAFIFDTIPRGPPIPA